MPDSQDSNGEIASITECPLYESCNPVRVKYVDWEGFNLSWCKAGYTNRLCSQCECNNETCDVLKGKECVECHPASTGDIIAAIAVGVCAVAAIILFDRHNLIIFVAEICVVIIFFIIGS